MTEEFEAKAASIVFPPRREDEFYTDDQRDQYFDEYRACVESLKALDGELVQRIAELGEDEGSEELEALLRLRETVGSKLKTGHAHLASMMINRIIQAR